MYKLKIPKINIEPIKMHSVSSIQIPNSLNSFTSLQPVVRVKKLQLFSATTVNVPSISINKCFYNGPKIILSPLKSNYSNRLNPINLRSPHWHRMHHSITKCGFKNCKCCKALSCNSTIRSTVNGRNFNINLNSDVD